MKVVQVKCPKCQNAFYSKSSDQVFLCENCGAMHSRASDGTAKVLEYEVGQFNTQLQGESIYLPFWRLYATVTIFSEQVEGGYIYKLKNMLQGESGSGNLFIFVPAIDMPPDTFKYWASSLTSSPPRYNAANDFNRIARLPVAISEREAEKLADFIILTNEAEKPGVMQNINYEVKVHDVRMVYLPFYIANGQYNIGL